jgi:hypothetical protein
MQPSDSPAASADAPVSPCRRPTTVRTLVLSRPRVRPQTRGAPEAFGGGASANPAIAVDRQGPPRLLGRPLQTCRGRPPRLGKRRLAHVAVASPAAFRVGDPLGFPGQNHFGAAFPRPTCSPAYASIESLLARLQGWLPACRARLWPGGIRTRWTTDRISWNHRMIPSFRTSIAWSQPPNGARGRLCNESNGTQARSASAGKGCPRACASGLCRMPKVPPFPRFTVWC